MFALLRCFWAVLRDGVRLWWLAPLVPLIVAIPEAVQHVAEFQLGMFAGKAQFAALAMDPVRLAFGVPKVIAVFLTVFAAIRFWATRGTGQAWYSPRGIIWVRLAMAFALMVASSLPGLLLAGSFSPDAVALINFALTIATLPLIAWFASALVGDRAMTLKAAFTSGWLPSLRIAIFVAAIAVPLQWLHEQNHWLAMGQAEGIVFALMAWDVLVVGTLAALMGTAIHHGLRPPGCEPMAENLSGRDD